MLTLTIQEHPCCLSQQSQIVLSSKIESLLTCHWLHQYYDDHQWGLFSEAIEDAGLREYSFDEATTTTKTTTHSSCSLQWLTKKVWIRGNFLANAAASNERAWKSGNYCIFLWYDVNNGRKTLSHLGYVSIMLDSTHLIQYHHKESFALT